MARPANAPVELLGEGGRLRLDADEIGVEGEALAQVLLVLRLFADEAQAAAMGLHAILVVLLPRIKVPLSALGLA